MAQRGFLVGGALVLVVAAGALFYWTRMMPQQATSPASSPVAVAEPTQSEPSREQKLMSQMQDTSKEGGYAVTFSDKDRGKWKLADGHTLEKFNSGSSGPAFARLTSSVPLEWMSNQWPGQGLSVLLPREFSELANGRTVEVGIIARSAMTNGSPSLSVIYATQQAGNSQWHGLKLKSQFEMYKFTYEVPKLEEGYKSEPIVVIHSDSPGSGRAIEIIGLYVKVVS